MHSVRGQVHVHVLAADAMDHACLLPAGKVVGARVLAVVRRTRAQSLADFQAALKVDGWEVVLPELVIAP